MSSFVESFPTLLPLGIKVSFSKFLPRGEVRWFDGMIIAHDREAIDHVLRDPERWGFRSDGKLVAMWPAPKAIPGCPP